MAVEKIADVASASTAHDSIIFKESSVNMRKGWWQELGLVGVFW